MTSRAQQWRQNARTATAQQAVDLTLPSGTVVKFCRPSLFHWVGGGRIPETFTATLERVNRASSAEERTRESQQAMMALSPEDQAQYQTFLQNLIIESVVDPKIVLGAPQNEDEISLAEIPDDDVIFLMTQALTLAPGVPVATKGGDVTLEDIETFRETSEGGVLAGAGSDMSEVRDSTL